MNTADKILKLAKEKGVKQSFLNNLIGGYRGKITEFSNGKTTLSRDELSIIADYFNVSLDYLLGNSEISDIEIEQDDETTEYLEILHKRPEMRMLFSVSKKATKADIEKAVKIIEALRGKE